MEEFNSSVIYAAKSKGVFSARIELVTVTFARIWIVVSCDDDDFLFVLVQVIFEFSVV